MQKKPWAICYR